MAKCTIPSLFQKDIKKLLVKRQRKFLHGAASGNPFSEPFAEVAAGYQDIIDNVGTLNYCDPKAMPAAGKTKRKVTDRNLWIGHCMRKPANGGLGKDMKACSDDWKTGGVGLLEKHKITRPAPGAEPAKKAKPLPKSMPEPEPEPGVIDEPTESPAELAKAFDFQAP